MEAEGGLAQEGGHELVPVDLVDPAPHRPLSLSCKLFVGFLFHRGLVCQGGGKRGDLHKRKLWDGFSRGQRWSDLYPQHNKDSCSTSKYAHTFNTHPPLGWKCVTEEPLLLTNTLPNRNMLQTTEEKKMTLVYVSHQHPERKCAAESGRKWLFLDLGSLLETGL